MPCVLFPPGGPLISKFVLTFRELASFHELLHAQVDLILVRRRVV